MAIITTLSRIRNLVRSLRAVDHGVYRPEEVELKLAEIRRLEAIEADDLNFIDSLRERRSYLQQSREAE